MSKSYSELIKIPTFEERFEYLKLDGTIGEDTFGMLRMLNQQFYSSQQWRTFRNKIVVRDNGCDMAFPDYPINGNAYVHHINPLTPYDLMYGADSCFDPENVVCVSFNTHQAITYGLPLNMRMYTVPVERKPNDQAPWRQSK